MKQFITKREERKLKKLHEELWDWLITNSDNLSLEKKNWPKWEHNGGKQAYVEHMCFACKVAMTIHDKMVQDGTDDIPGYWENNNPNEYCHVCPCVNNMGVCNHNEINYWDEYCAATSEGDNRRAMEMAVLIKHAWRKI